MHYRVTYYFSKDFSVVHMVKTDEPSESFSNRIFAENEVQFHDSSGTLHRFLMKDVVLTTIDKAHQEA
ncbi:hypothetical protein [Sinobaca sp. H24]|uniref:hypothetical protein n=1 Tax=Sinobaca sp. H24 TaxID=2923376 RepID=UPI00207A30F3|nr:hypothetical protein [Sinobaca sp. H24]